MKPSFRHGLLAAVGLGLTTALLWLFFSRTPWGGMADSLLSASPGWLLLSFFFVLSSFGFRTIRWGYLLDVEPRVSFRIRFETFIEGYTVTNLVPGRVGELARPYFLSQDTPQVPFTKALATVVVERFLDGLMLVVFLFTFLIFFAENLPADSRFSLKALHMAGYAVGGFLLLGLFAFGAAYAFRDKTLAAAQWLTAFFHKTLRDKILDFIKTFVDGLSALHQGRRLIGIAWATVGTWLSIASFIWLSLIAVGLDVRFPDMFLLVPIEAIGIIIPTPGGIGGYHAFLQAGLLDIYGFEPAVSSAGVILSHAIAYVPLTAWGLILMSQRGIKLAGIRKDVLQKKTEENESSV